MRLHTFDRNLTQAKISYCSSTDTRKVDYSAVNYYLCAVVSVTFQSKEVNIVSMEVQGMLTDKNILI